ncbi:MAG: UvrD-helicase domain-containing protein [Spirochaetaceae bacterium]|nr:UvrD-helicase domain-containing protein [Spirochaetaceae bacterium]
MYLLLHRKIVDANIDSAASSCVRFLLGNAPLPYGPHRLFEIKGAPAEAFLLTSSGSDEHETPVVIIPFPLPTALKFTPIDPLADPDVGLAFARGVLRAARDIWANERKPGVDFDRDGVFYRHPFSLKEGLARQTTVFLNLAQTAADLADGTDDPSGWFPDLLLCGFGNPDEGLPLLEVFKDSHLSALEDVKRDTDGTVGLIDDDSSRILIVNSSSFVPAVTTLTGSHSPAWLSYGQWMKKLAGTSQGDFIAAAIRGPQRVDGPAGSGKTLSLVLKCLHTLNQAKERDEQHHAALVVFSEETRERIVSSFLQPLDEEGFHTRGRGSGAPQTLTVTTLLSWSREALTPVIGEFSLSADNPAQARQDQHGIVRDVLNAHLPGFVAAAKSALSKEMKALCSGGTNDVLVGMFAHEFGVVIKGMAEGSRRRYLTVDRPAIGLPCANEADRRFVYAIFERYEEALRSYGCADLDDIAISHIKLLQMPLRREARENVAFDSVFVDEAHSFNPNELAIFFLLTRRSELPPLVVAVDLPQGVGDKGYAEGGLDEAMLRDLEARENVDTQRFELEDVYRCSQPILDLASSIYAQGHAFFAPVRVPGILRSASTGAGRAQPPLLRKYDTVHAMLEGALDTAEELAGELSCNRSDVVVVLLHDGLAETLPKRLLARSVMLTKRADNEAERRAQRQNQFVVSRPEHLHGLEFSAAVIVGASRNEVPRSTTGAGTAAVFETQRTVDLIYIALTRARQRVAVLYLGEPTFLLEDAIKRGLFQG